jgi:hypothetical protein
MNRIPFSLLAVLAVLPLHAQQDPSGVKYGRVYASGENPVIRLLSAAGAAPITDAIRIAFTDNEKLAEYLGKEISPAFLAFSETGVR